MVFAAPLSAKVRRCGGGLVGYFSWLALSVKACRLCQIPPFVAYAASVPLFVTCGDISPRPGRICPGRGKSFLEVGALGSPRRLHLFAKASPFDRLPRPGEVARSARRGIRWICEAKTERARLLPLCDVPFSLSTPAICAITTTFREKVSSPRWRKPKAGAGKSRF